MKKFIYFGVTLGAINFLGLAHGGLVSADEISGDTVQLTQAVNNLDESMFGNTVSEGHSVVKRDKEDNPYNSPKLKYLNKLSIPGKFEKCVAQGIKGSVLTGGNPLGFVGGVGKCLIWQ